MVNARTYIKAGLDTICSTVKINYPEGEVTLPIITYIEVSNNEIGKWQTMIEYQIDVYHSTFEDLIDLVDDADAVMKSLGFNRTYASSDSVARVGTGLYHKILSYNATVNTHEMNIFTEV